MVYDQWYPKHKSKEWEDWITSSKLDDLDDENVKVECVYDTDDYEECINSKEFKEYKRMVNLAEEWEYEYYDRRGNIRGYHRGYDWTDHDGTPDFEVFKQFIKDGKIKKLSEFEYNEPFTYNFGDLYDALDLVSGYSSYPEFRNEYVLQSLIDDFENNNPMARPIAVQCDEEDEPVIMSGNTRVGLAKMLGIDPEILVIRHKGCK